ncbi:MAG: response regulator [Alphaproteobacteria bacterium]|nr:response regulator [Alphaproteobacteria bacterium]
MPLNVLIADDSATNRSLFTLTLTRMGHHADAAASGREAIDLFAAHEYDLAFIDLQMPQMSGFALAEYLSPRNARHTPLYAISGFIDAETEARALAAGFCGCFIKPLDREKILRAAEDSGLRDKSAAMPDAAGTVNDIPARLLSVYARELRTRAAACEKHWQAGDLQALQREAHTIRALAEMLKTADVADAAAQVENLQRANHSIFSGSLSGSLAPHLPAAAGLHLRALCQACARTAASIERRTPPNTTLT